MARYWPWLAGRLISTPLGGANSTMRAPCLSHEPVLKQALKEDWDALAPVIRAHYGLAPFTTQQVRLQGKMHHVSHSPLANLLIPFARLAGALIPYQGHDVPVHVVNRSLSNRPNYYWERVFFFPGRRPFEFASSMVFTGDHEITEYTRFGFGIRLGLSVNRGGLIERDRGYVLTIGRISIHLPLNLTMGWVSIEERPVSATEFDMEMTLRHPLFGQTFAYDGTFAVVSE